MMRCYWGIPLLLLFLGQLALGMDIAVAKWSWNETIQLQTTRSPSTKYISTDLGPNEAHILTVDPAGASCTPQQSMYFELWELAVQTSASPPLTLFDTKEAHALCIAIHSKNETGNIRWRWDSDKGILGNSAGWSGSEQGISCGLTSYRQVVSPPAALDHWTITLLNFRAWHLQRYAVRVTCVAATEGMSRTGALQLPCPAPVLGKALCAGHGTCQKATSVCKCDPGWTDYGCGREEPPLLAVGAWQEVNVTPECLPSPDGNYQQALLSVVAPPDATVLIVEMQWLPASPSDAPGRTGRPLLFAAPEPSTHPAVLSGASFLLAAGQLNPQAQKVFEASDAGGLAPVAAQQAVFFQQGGEPPMLGGRYLVAVVNRLGAGTARVQVRARVAEARDPRPCPFDCSGNGECKVAGTSGTASCRCKNGFYGPFCQYPRAAPPFPLTQYSKRRVALSPQPVSLPPGGAAYFVITKPARIWLDTANLYLAITSSPASTVVVTTTDNDGAQEVDELRGVVAPREKPFSLLRASGKLRYSFSSTVTIAITLDGDQPASVQVLLDMPRPLMQPKVQVVAIYTAVALLAPMLVIITLCMRARRIARIEEYDARQLGLPVEPRRWLRLRHITAALRPLPPVRLGGNRSWGLHMVYIPPSRGVPKEVVELFPVIEFEGACSLDPVEIPVGWEALRAEAQGLAQGGRGQEGEQGGQVEGGQVEGVQGQGQQGEAAAQQVEPQQKPQQKQEVAVAASSAASAAAGKGGEEGRAEGEGVSGVAAGGGPAAGAAGEDDAATKNAAQGDQGDDDRADPPVDLACPICLLDYTRGEYLRQLLPCHHTYHRRCIDDWLRDHSSCPICRQDLLVHTTPNPDHPIPGFNPPTNPPTPPSDPAAPASALTRTSRTLHSAAAILLAAVRSSTSAAGPSASPSAAPGTATATAPSTGAATPDPNADPAPPPAAQQLPAAPQAPTPPAAAPPAANPATLPAPPAGAVAVTLPGAVAGPPQPDAAPGRTLAAATSTGAAGNAAPGAPATCVQPRSGPDAV